MISPLHVIFRPSLLFFAVAILTVIIVTLARVGVRIRAFFVVIVIITAWSVLEGGELLKGGLLD